MYSKSSGNLYVICFGHRKTTTIVMTIDKELINKLLDQVKASDRLHINHDMRTTLLIPVRECSMQCTLGQ